MTEPREQPTSEEGWQRYETPENIGRAGLIAIAAGLLLALLQVIGGASSGNSLLWVIVCIGTALVGVGLRIEAAIRSRRRPGP
ncbi:hypothetical protein [Nonomuraea sp. NPDC002799]